MKKKDEEKRREELEQFEAYGEYSYAYRHATDQRRGKGKRLNTAEPTGTEPGAEESAEEESELEEETQPVLTPEEKARIRSRSITGRLILLLAIVVAAIIILQGTAFRLRTVYVIGNVHRTAQQVAGASGLVKGLNIFAISEDEVRKNLASDHTIVFLGLQKDYPSTIYLYISEREPVAATQWLGLLYTLDEEGMVMDETNSTSMPAGMPTVTGFQITNIHVGQKMEVRNQEQMRAYYDIMAELRLQYYRDQIQDINLTDSDNLYLLTVTGISVRLGSREFMRAKIGALRTDIAYLQQLGKTSGLLDVTIPEDAKYRPDS